MILSKGLQSYSFDNCKYLINVGEMCIPIEKETSIFPLLNHEEIGYNKEHASIILTYLWWTLNEIKSKMPEYFYNDGAKI